jgi:hypothetical protein
MSCDQLMHQYNYNIQLDLASFDPYSFDPYSFVSEGSNFNLETNGMSPLTLAIYAVKQMYRTVYMFGSTSFPRLVVRPFPNKIIFINCYKEVVVDFVISIVLITSDQLLVLLLSSSGRRCPRRRLPGFAGATWSSSPWILLSFVFLRSFYLTLNSILYTWLIRRRSGRFARMDSWVARSSCWCWLLCLRFIEIRGLTCPSFIGELGEFLHLDLSDDVSLLFFDAWRVVTDISEPLVPLSWNVVSH